MSKRVAINHKSEYQYDRPVFLSPHIFRLKPAPHCRTIIESYSLTILPDTHYINWQQDPFGNYQTRVVFTAPTEVLTAKVNLVANMIEFNPFDFFIEDCAEYYPFNYNPQLRKELTLYLEITECGQLLTKWLKGVDRSRQNIIDFLVNLNRRIREDISHIVRMEPGIQSCENTLHIQSGSCRDSSWLFVQILRHLGLAARFVSGYLIQLIPDETTSNDVGGPTEDFTDLHAWCEVYVPGAGWIGLDSTSGLFAGEGHIPLACVSDPVSAAAVTGYTDPCETTFTYTNTIKRL
ncbi:transglutaminase family protein [Candidatus Poribacteria bacterium]|nr:transglutaminase family protein [Candidatus Poribacteria bacterium]